MSSWQPALARVPAERPAIAYAVFLGPTEQAGWWSALLHPAFRHCFVVLAEEEQGPSMIMTHEGMHLRLGVSFEPPRRYLARLSDHVALRAYAVPPAAAPHRPMLRPAMTCVEVCKAALGIADWRIVTPRQLARHLERTGASRWHRYSPEGA